MKSLISFLIFTIITITVAYPQYDYVGEFNEGLAYVKKNRKYGYYNAPQI